MATITISTRLSEESIKLLDKLARKNQKTKSKIIEDSLKIYYENEMKKNIISSYSNIGKDDESIELTETGVNDFLLSYN
ncbi:ribbon-helix-helix protein, CopG family [Candidatus Gracilibacteria bacterium]|nr:ribbon-helix-helix protein, CopG family [Candidatus Gracilibacteria bacterium]